MIFTSCVEYDILLSMGSSLKFARSSGDTRQLSHHASRTRGATPGAGRSQGEACPGGTEERAHHRGRSQPTPVEGDRGQNPGSLIDITGQNIALMAPI